MHIERWLAQHFVFDGVVVWFDVSICDDTDNPTTIWFAAEFGRFCMSPLMSQQLSQFSRETVDLLKSCQYCRLPFSRFIPAYHHHFGRQCRVADYGYTKLAELFNAIPHVVEVS